MAQADEAAEPVRLPERAIGPPSTISAAARQALSTLAASPRMERPDPADHDAWRRLVAESDAQWRSFAEDRLARCAASVETRTIAGLPVHVGTPAAAEPDQPVYLYAHGGAFVFGGGAFARANAAIQAESLGLATYAVDYRMPPDHPFPAAPEDVVAVYHALIERSPPRRIAIGGSSAGGNIAAAAVLMIRDRGLPLPGAAVLLTPEVDLTESGDSFRTNEGLDVVLKAGLPECNALYAAGRDLADPYLSPIFADLSPGFPPTFIQSGTRDLFLSNSVLMHRRLRAAGIEADLHVWEAMPHGGFGFGDVPENAEIEREVGAFIARHCR